MRPLADDHRCLQNACMPAITVRNVPQPTRDALAARAARAGQSLQEYLLAELERIAASPTIGEWLERADRNRPEERHPIAHREIIDWIDEGRTRR